MAIGVVAWLYKEGCPDSSLLDHWQHPLAPQGPTAQDTRALKGPLGAYCLGTWGPGTFLSYTPFNPKEMPAILL